MRKFTKILVLLMILTISFQFATVKAAEGKNRIDISVSDTKTQKAVKGVVLSIYRITEGEADSYQISKSFSGAGVTMADLSDTKNLSKTVSKLEKYLVKQNLQPLESKQPDEDGKMSFVGLQDGVYMIRQDRNTEGGEDANYSTKTFLVVVPTLDKDGNYVRHIECQPKGTIQGDVTEVVVNKIWKDNNDTVNRPKEITVGLYKDEKLQEKVTLNAENNWHHKWKNLNPDSSWTVHEINVPEGYTSQETTVDGVCTITNTKNTPPGTPPGGTTPGGTSPAPKTGDTTNLLMWGILLLASAGILVRVKKRT